MADEFLQRGVAAKTDDCPVVTPEAVTPVLPPVRPEPPCGPDGQPLVPETFEFPSTPPSVQPLAPSNVPSVPVPSAPLTLTCADLGGGPIGDAVSLPLGQVTGEFLFQEIDNIRDDQLAYILSLSDAVRATVVGANAATAAATFKLTTTQAEQAVELIAAVQEQVNAQALETAQGLIICAWENSPQTAVCGTGAVLSPNPPTEANNPVTIAAGQFFSQTSQADADSQALQEAQRLLGCFWGNDEQTVTCATLGFTEPVQNDTTPVYPGLPLRVGTVTFAANTVFSPSSKADANQQAVQLASAQLSCFYVNAALNLNCADLGYPGSENLGPADPIAGTPGSSVIIPAGFITSQVSTTDADAQALAQATALLDCYYTNAEQTVTCPNQTIIINGVNIVVPPSSTSSQITYTVAAGTVQSLVSVADANAQALALANAQLRCLYCNIAVQPVCLPAGTPTSPLPVTATPNNDWSLDATLGVAAGTFCDESAQAAQQIAQTVGDIPVSNFATGSNCTYGNDEFKAACVSGPGVYGKFPGTGSINYRNTLSPNSRPTPSNAGDIIVMAADTFIVGENEVPVDYEIGNPNRGKLYANKVVRDMAISMLDCYFGSDTQTVPCNAQSSPITVPYGVTFSPPERPARQLAASQPGFLEAGIVTSTASKENANAQALAQATSMTNCQYGNTEVSATITQGGKPCSATIAADTFTASTPDSADTQAAFMVQALCDSEPGGSGEPCEGSIQATHFSFDVTNIPPLTDEEILALSEQVLWIATSTAKIVVTPEADGSTSIENQPGNAAAGNGFAVVTAPCNFYRVAWTAPTGWELTSTHTSTGSVGDNSTLELEAYFRPISELSIASSSGRIKLSAEDGMLIYKPGATDPAVKIEKDGKVTIYKDGSTEARVEINQSDIPNGQLMKARATVGCDNMTAMVMRTDWY